MAKSLLDELLGLGEAGLTLGTGAVSGMVGMPYGLYKGITGGGYGTPAGVQQAQREAEAFMQRNTYQPRTEAGQGIVESLGQAMAASKLPPVMPEAMALSSIPRQAYLAQAERKGMDLERAIAPAVERTLNRGGLPAELLQGMAQGSRSNVYLPSTPKKPNPQVGTRYQREFLGGLAPKTPVKIEDYQGASLMVMPWDSTSRNYSVSGVSDEVFPTPIITHGGQDYARDLAHIQQGIGGASGLSIAKRIRDRDKFARQENIMAGGTGEILHLPITMGAGSENFSMMPTQGLLQLLDMRNLSKSQLQGLDESIRNFKVAKGTGEKRKVTTPFKNFAGLSSEEGRIQIQSGEGLGSTPGELRKAIVDRLTTKGSQELLNFNAEDLSAALTDPALAGVPKGYVGNTVLMTDPIGMHLRPSSNPSYNTDFTAQYMGTLGQNVPIEVLAPGLMESLTKEFAGKKGDIRNMALGAMEKRKEGVSPMINQEMIDNYYRYLEQQKNR